MAEIVLVLLILPVFAFGIFVGWHSRGRYEFIKQAADRMEQKD